MVLFVGNPTNVVICEGFRVNNAAFTAYTILPFLACSMFCLLALAIQFRSSKYIPRRLNVTGDLDVQSVLLDPIGAWVGSFILGTCLVVIIIVSFFHIDVWKISLPFAVAKFLYDMTWDHYRYVKKIPMLGQTHRGKRSEEDLSVSAVEEDIMLKQLRQHRTQDLSKNLDQAAQNSSQQNPPSNKHTLDEHLQPSASQTRTNTNARSNTAGTQATLFSTTPINSISSKGDIIPFANLRRLYVRKRNHFASHFPTFYTALPRLPFALVPFAFSQFILIEGLAHQGWIEIFANWLVRASDKKMHPTIWLIGVLGVILCNISGTNIGATILLTKVVRAANYPDHSSRAAAIALAVASNIGAVSFTFSASLAGLLWRQILAQKGIFIKQRDFAYWNSFPLLVMTVVGLGVVSAEMAVLY